MMRRRLRAISVAAVTGSLAISLAACSGSQTAGNSKTATLNFADLATSTPEGAGQIANLKWNLPFEPSNIDWTRPYNWAEPTVDANICEGLFRYTADFSKKPNLATKVAVPNDLTYIFTLRPGVKFWDGHPMTAADVVYSLERNEDPSVGSVFSKYYLNVSSIKATGPLQVTVKMKRPDATFLQAMASPAGDVGEEAYIKKAGKAYGSPTGGAMCTGPFKFVSWTPGQSIILERNNSYWDTTRVPKVQKITFSFISDESTEVNALRSGELDGAYFPTPPAGLSKLQSDPNGKVYLGRSLDFFTLVTTAQSGPFADPRVRNALLDALDRPAIARTIFQGTALPAKAIVGPSYWGYSKQTYQQAYDKLPNPHPNYAEAKKLIHEAGATGKSITIAAQGSSAVYAEIASLLEAAGSAIGLNVHIKIVPINQFGNLYNDPSARKGIAGFLTDWYGQIAEPLDIYDLFAVPGGYNYTNYIDEASSLNKALGQLSDQQRADTIVPAQQGITNNLPWLPLVQDSNILFMNKRISGAIASFPFVETSWAVTIGATGK